MADGNPREPRDELPAVVERKARRKATAPQRRRLAWFGFRMFGLVGWSVILPTLLGVAIGAALDRTAAERRFSWTLALMLAGLAVGCANAWYWVSRESRRD